MQRPTSIPVLGGLNLLFGVLGLFGLIGSVLVLAGMKSSNPVHGLMEASVVFRTWQHVATVLGFISTGALIAAGAGLLMSKAWGRTLSIGYGIYAIVMGLIGSVFNAVYLVGPLLEQATAKSGPEAIGAAGGAIGGMLGACFGLIYPIVLLVFMYRANVVEFFRAPGAQPAA